ncbi:MULTISPECIES: Hsp70 family protein [Candidatus Ichthyocystis]|uniref:Hsp70 family protein n=1 Tax=Candidatus Ichthyocystis TaxID=2929841 RepID=UPI000A91A352|nr:MULTISPECIES: Hsp70 family protein [Ichthyocystis]
MSYLVSITEPEDSYDDEFDSEVVGIDLGTTNSLIAAYEESSGPYVIPSDSEADDILLPSAVCYAEDGVYVGHDALAFLDSSSDRVFLSIKRYIGRLDEQQREDIAATYKEEQDGTYAYFDTPQGRKSAIDISSDILRVLKDRALAHLKKSIRGAVITVPAHFNSPQRQATRLAAHRANLQVLRIINEPTAAALAYGLEKEEQGYFMVYDLGGGTFDISLLHLSEGIFEVIATAGHPNIGGDNFDRALFEILCSKHRELRLDEWSYYRIAIRFIKEQLSFSDSITYDITTKSGECIYGDIERIALEEKTDHILQKTFSTSKKVLHQSGIINLDGIVLVGGATRMPAVVNGLKNLFGNDPLNDIDPDTVVAIGAAAQAHQLNSPDKKHPLLLDVTPMSLGIEVMGGLMEVIVPKHTPIPTAKEEIFTTFKDGQVGFDFKVLQGEREHVDDCHSIGTFHLRGLPSRIAGEVRVRVIFQIDVDGLLSVTAESLCSDHIEQLDTSWSEALSSSVEEESSKLLEEDMLLRSKVEKVQEARRVIQAIDRFTQNVTRNESNILLIERIVKHRNSLQSYLENHDMMEIDVNIISEEVGLLNQISRNMSLPHGR